MTEAKLPDRNRTYYVGTSGWTYAHWKEVFYPRGLAQSKWFAFYAQRYNAVEVNATFYRPFPESTYAAWQARAPQGFLYVLKAPRLITHEKRLVDVQDDIRMLWRAASRLGDKLGLVLLQLASDAPYDLHRLREAITALDSPRQVAVEFRHAQWFNPQVRRLLEELGAVMCNADSPFMPLTDWVTSPSAYIRLHGRASWYDSNYSPTQLEEIAAKARGMTHSGAQRVFIFFNNDLGGYAPHNAAALAQLLA